MLGREFEQHDLLDLGEKLNHMSKTDQWDQMAAEVPDDVVHLFAAVGRHDQIRDAIATRFGGIADVVSAGDLPPELIQDLRQLPATFSAFAPVTYRG